MSIKKLPFIKLVGSGNDFVLVDCTRKHVAGAGLKKLAQKMCLRQFGAGADGLLAAERSVRADIRMRIFNADGSEAEMCGNGARCFALWFLATHKKQKMSIETKAGIVYAESVPGTRAQRKGGSREKSSCSRVRIQLPDPTHLRFNVPLAVLGRKITVQHINTGVPHTVVFVEGLEKMDINTIGREIRNHAHFAPGGTNADLVQITGDHAIAVRTYERGVEAETLACGTGAVAAAIVSMLKGECGAIGEYNIVRVETKGGEALRVYFRYNDDTIHEVWLEGKAEIVYKGEYYV